jgi:hypothetical protein
MTVELNQTSALARCASMASSATATAPEGSSSSSSSPPDDTVPSLAPMAVHSRFKGHKQSISSVRFSTGVDSGRFIASACECL